MTRRADNGDVLPVQKSVQTVSYLWIAMPIVVMAGLFFASLVWLMVKKKQLTTGVSECGAPFTLEQIRQMKDQGTLSQQEYEKLRIMIIRDTIPDCTMVANQKNGVDQDQRKGPLEEEKGDSWRDNGISE